MLIYFIFLLAALGPSLANSSKPRIWSPAFKAYFYALLVFLGLRFNVGADWDGYEYLYHYYKAGTWDDAYNFAEPGFVVLNKLSEGAGFGFQGVIFFCSLVFLYGCFAFASTTSDPWMAVASVMPYLVYIISTSGIRQAAAIGVGLYVVARAKSITMFRQLLVIALAISFHNSAALLLVFVIASLKVGVTLRALAMAMVAGFIAITLDDSDAVEKYNSVYLEYNVVSDGAFFHVLLIAFPGALYLFYRKKILAVVPDDVNVHVASYMALGTMPLLSISSTGFDRLSLYLAFVQMWVYPALVEARVAPRFLLVATISGLTMTTFLVYFIFGSYITEYVPYHNALFAD